MGTLFKVGYLISLATLLAALGTSIADAGEVVEPSIIEAATELEPSTEVPQDYVDSGLAVSEDDETLKRLVAYDEILFNPPDLSRLGSFNGERTSGASRSGGIESVEELTALSPDSNMGLTAEQYPAFMFFIPFEEEQFDSLEFSVFDSETKEEIHTVQLEPPSNLPGILPLSLPEDGAGLLPSKNYLWTFSLFVDSREEAEDPDVERYNLNGWIRHEPLQGEFEEEVALAGSRRERAAIYARQGYWYSALSHLSVPETDGQSNVMQNVRLDDWTDLLEGIGLSHLANKSIIDCCIR